MIEVVVFDMDGVIVDSEPVWQEARVDLIDDHGGVWTERDGDETRGLASEVWATRISERLEGELTPDQVFTQILERMVTAYEERLPLFPGAVDAIMRVADDFTVAVASGSPDVLIDVVLKNSGLDGVAAAVGYGDRVPQGKPAPDVYLDVLRRLHVEPSRAVGVEDSESGLKSVQSAGMHAIALVTPGYQLSDEVLNDTALRIERLDELTASLLHDLTD